jgi:hypothetical protein
MGPGLDNEQLVQAGIPTRMWLTKKLWGFASEPPYLHHGRATTITEAILQHGGEGQASRDAFAALPTGDRAKVVAFLKTLQILPPDASSLVLDGPAGEPVGDAPTVRTHVAQADVETGVVGVDALVAHGRAIFAASFNALDGQGRPTSTGTGGPRVARTFPQHFNRISGPDANSCLGCHNLPSIGGGGDQVANVFVLGQRFVNRLRLARGRRRRVQRTRCRASRTSGTRWGCSRRVRGAPGPRADGRAPGDPGGRRRGATGRATTSRALVAKGIAFGSVTAHATTRWTRRPWRAWTPTSS